MMSSASGKVSDRVFYGRILAPVLDLSNFYDDERDVALLILRSAWPKALPMVQEKNNQRYHGG